MKETHINVLMVEPGKHSRKTTMEKYRQRFWELETYTPEEVENALVILFSTRYE